MKFSSKIKPILQFIVKPSIFAFIITLIILPFMPFSGKYSVKLIDSGVKYPHENFYYNDLNGDGKSEKIVATEADRTLSSLVYDEGQIVGQWNYNGTFAIFRHHYFGDYDSNGLKEIYVFTTRNDSLFLWADEIYSKKSIIKSHFVTQIHFYNKKPDLEICDIQLIPGKTNSFRNLYFATFASYSYRPRKLFIYNIKDDSLFATPESGSCFNNPYLANIDKDPQLEFFGTVPAYENSPGDYLYTDSLAWIMAYDNNLSFLFKPVKIGTHPALVTVLPFAQNNNYNLAVLYNHYGLIDHSSLSVYSINGKLLHQKRIDYNREDMTIFTNQNLLLLFYYSTGKIEEYNNKLEKINTRKTVSVSKTASFKTVDLDSDGEPEYICKNAQNSDLVIFRNNLTHPVLIPFSDSKTGLICSLKKESKKNLLSLSFDRDWFLYRYGKNPMYYIQYARYLGIWLILFLVIRLIEKTQRAVAEQKFENERQIASLQLNALDNQLNPHFTLNILNSIGALYENKDVEKARYYFGKYSKLLRQSVLLSGKVAVPVTKEIEFTRNYLELEKLRMNFLFDYRIEGKENLEGIEIPKLLIHNFVENAVKHGIRRLKSGGLILIRFQKYSNQLEIVISDNGIGREAARQYSLMSTGKGLQLVNRALDIYFNLKKIKIEYKITDIYKDDGSPAGTEVKITVPFKNE